MNASRASWKSFAARFLPGAIQTWLKKVYYPRVVSRFPEERWPGASVVRELVGPGDCVVDAGANIGYVTAMLARWVGTAGLVHAFEPVPETCDLLRHNMDKLSLRQVLVHACGLSSGSSTASMVIPDYPDGGKNLYEARLVSSETLSSAAWVVDVRIESLDAVLRDAIRPVTFMKIDVEGHELNVVRGAVSILQRDHPALYMEVSGNPDDPVTPAAELFDFLSNLGYEARVGQETDTRPRMRGDRETDYFFLCPQHLSRLTT